MRIKFITLGGEESQNIMGGKNLTDCRSMPCATSSGFKNMEIPNLLEPQHRILIRIRTSKRICNELFILGTELLGLGGNRLFLEADKDLPVLFISA